MTARPISAEPYRLPNEKSPLVSNAYVTGMKMIAEMTVATRTAR